MRRWLRRWRRHRHGDFGTFAGACEVCDRPDPMWSVSRWGDAVVSWACNNRHLAVVCERLQRDHEVTKLEVRCYPKAVEWATIGRDLDAVAGEQP